MNNRLQQFLAAENITQSTFAESIGVTKASVSHVLAGRNKPGFEFIESIARRYPNLNIEWLITGKGRMYKNQGERTLFPHKPDGDDLFMEEVPSTPLPAAGESRPDVQADLPSGNRQSAAGNRVSASGEPETHISKILIFYNDGTYKEIK